MGVEVAADLDQPGLNIADQVFDQTVRVIDKVGHRHVLDRLSREGIRGRMRHRNAIWCQ
jgi:hypothetical protein